MNSQALAEELGQLHVGFAKVFNLEETFLAHGSDRILIWLNQKHDTVYASDIVSQFHLTPGRVANILKQLELKKMIMRVRDESDLRKYKIEVTEKGRAKANESWQKMLDGFENLMNRLEEDDAEKLLQLLKKIAKL